MDGFNGNIDFAGDRERQGPEKKRRSLWKLDLLGVILILIALFFLVRWLRNDAFAKTLTGLQEQRYENEGGAGSLLFPGTIKTEDEKGLLKFNFPESYVPYYNLGNAAYLEGRYDDAIALYGQALAQHPGFFFEEKECRVRINLALSILAKVDLNDLASEKKMTAAINQLMAARNVLTENGCANPEPGVFDGHSEEAEQLKKEIDDLLKQLQNQSPQQSEDQEQDQGQDQDQNQNDSQKDQESLREKELRRKSEEQRRKSAQERADADREQDYREGDGEGGSNDQYDGKTW